jgi:SAM-dependent methyltransferase
MMLHLRRLLLDPHSRGSDEAAPGWWEIHARAIRRKGLVRRIHEEWYQQLAGWLPDRPGPVVEIGSGGGGFSDTVPTAVRTDCPARPGIQLGVDATALPFGGSSLRALVLINVFHHLSRPREFLSGALRALRPGGRVLLLEPWITPWSRFIYRTFHHEPCDPEAIGWDSAVASTLSGANEALAWIVFSRDRARFEAEFPGLSLLSVRPQMPAIYLLSGGIASRPLAPGAAAPFLRWLERPFDEKAAMFAAVVLERR